MPENVVVYLYLPLSDPCLEGTKTNPRVLAPIKIRKVKRARQNIRDQIFAWRWYCLLRHLQNKRMMHVSNQFPPFDNHLDCSS